MPGTTPLGRYLWSAVPRRSTCAGASLEWLQVHTPIFQSEKKRELIATYYIKCQVVGERWNGGLEVGDLKVVICPQACVSQNSRKRYVQKVYQLTKNEKRCAGLRDKNFNATRK